MVSARACANQFLPYSPIARQVLHYLACMGTVQADSRLNSEQIDTLFISVEGQEGGLGGGRYIGENLHVTVMIFFCTLLKLIAFELITPKLFTLRL